METCPYSSQLGAYHDGELPNEQRRQLDEHLASCPICLAELRQLQRLSTLLINAPIPPLSAPARQHLYGLATAFVGEAAYLRIAKWTTALAASVLLAASLWMPANRPAGQATSDSTQAWQVALNPSEPADTRAESGFADWVVMNLSTSGSHE